MMKKIKLWYYFNNILKISQYNKLIFSLKSGPISYICVPLELFPLSFGYNNAANISPDEKII